MVQIDVYICFYWFCIPLLFTRLTGYCPLDSQLLVRFVSLTTPRLNQVKLTQQCANASRASYKFTEKKIMLISFALFRHWTRPLKLINEGTATVII